MSEAMTEREQRIEQGRDFLLRESIELAKENAELREMLRQRNEAIEQFVSLLTCYYWGEHDEELGAVNRLRRLVGWRDQLPKAEEAELQVDEAERGVSPKQEEEGGI